MAHYQTTLNSRRSVEDAFTYLGDFSHCQSWDPSVDEAVRLDDGPVALGSRFRVTASFLRRTVQLEYAITTYEFPHRVVFSASLPRLSSVDEITITTDAGVTNVTYRSDLRALGVFRMLDPVLGFFFQRLASRAREGLVRELNS
jgi:hypothetical protein